MVLNKLRHDMPRGGSSRYRPKLMNRFVRAFSTDFVLHRDWRRPITFLIESYLVIRTVIWTLIFNPLFFRRRVVLVCAADERYWQYVVNLIQSVRIRNCSVVFYDLGLSHQRHLEFEVGIPVDYRLFNSPRFHQNFCFEHCAGCYAWKPVIVKEVVDRETDAIVIWMDSQNLQTSRLWLVRAATLMSGFYCPRSSGRIGAWTHPRALDILNAHDLRNKRNLNAAAIAFDASQPQVRALVNDWYEFAMNPYVSCPDGSNRGNHRHDQSILSVLGWRSNLARQSLRKSWRFVTHQGTGGWDR